MKVVFVLCATLIGIACSTNPEEGDLFEGDMELDPDQVASLVEQQSKGNQFAAIRAGLWRSTTIPYYIDSRIRDATAAINDAIKDYHRYTCLKFTQYTRRPSGPHIYFTTGSGCSSPVGQRSSGNHIKLARGCWRKGTVIHEIGHSIGLFHEQSRPDRDTYVTILWNNIKSANKHNFNKYSTSRINSRGSPYDFGSIMHYGSNYFAINRSKNTIQTKESRNQGKIGQRRGFSKTDIAQIRSMYNC